MELSRFYDIYRSSKGSRVIITCGSDVRQGQLADFDFLSQTVVIGTTEGEKRYDLEAVDGIEPFAPMATDDIIRILIFNFNREISFVCPGRNIDGVLTGIFRRYAVLLTASGAVFVEYGDISAVLRDGRRMKPLSPRMTVRAEPVTEPATVPLTAPARQTGPVKAGDAAERQKADKNAKRPEGEQAGSDKKQNDAPAKPAPEKEQPRPEQTEKPAAHRKSTPGFDPAKLSAVKFRGEELSACGDAAAAAVLGEKKLNAVISAEPRMTDVEKAAVEGRFDDAVTAVRTQGESGGSDKLIARLEEQKKYEPTGELSDIGDALSDVFGESYPLTVYFRALAVAEKADKDKVVDLIRGVYRAGGYFETVYLFNAYKSVLDVGPELLLYYAAALFAVGDSSACVSVADACLKNFPDAVKNSVDIQIIRDAAAEKAGPAKSEARSAFAEVAPLKLPALFKKPKVSGVRPKASTPGAGAKLVSSGAANEPEAGLKDYQQFRMYMCSAGSDPDSACEKLRKSSQTGKPDPKQVTVAKKASESSVFLTRNQAAALIHTIRYSRSNEGYIALLLEKARDIPAMLRGVLMYYLRSSESDLLDLLAFTVSNKLWQLMIFTSVRLFGLAEQESGSRKKIAHSVVHAVRFMLPEPDMSSAGEKVAAAKLIDRLFRVGGNSVKTYSAALKLACTYGFYTDYLSLYGDGLFKDYPYGAAALLADAALSGNTGAADNLLAAGAGSEDKAFLAVCDAYRDYKSGENTESAAAVLSLFDVFDSHADITFVTEAARLTAMTEGGAGRICEALMTLAGKHFATCGAVYSCIADLVFLLERDEQTEKLLFSALLNLLYCAEDEDAFYGAALRFALMCGYLRSKGSEFDAKKARTRVDDPMMAIRSASRSEVALTDGHRQTLERVCEVCAGRPADGDEAFAELCYGAASGNLADFFTALEGRPEDEDCEFILSLFPALRLRSLLMTCLGDRDHLDANREKVKKLIGQPMRFDVMRILSEEIAETQEVLSLPVERPAFRNTVFSLLKAGERISYLPPYLSLMCIMHMAGMYEEKESRYLNQKLRTRLVYEYETRLARLSDLDESAFIVNCAAPILFRNRDDKNASHLYKRAVNAPDSKIRAFANAARSVTAITRNLPSYTSVCNSMPVYAFINMLSWLAGTERANEYPIFLRYFDDMHQRIARTVLRIKRMDLDGVAEEIEALPEEAVCGGRKLEVRKAVREFYYASVNYYNYKLTKNDENYAGDAEVIKREAEKVPHNFRPQKFVISGKADPSIDRGCEIPPDRILFRPNTTAC